MVAAADGIKWLEFDAPLETTAHKNISHLPRTAGGLLGCMRTASRLGAGSTVKVGGAHRPDVASHSVARTGSLSAGSGLNTMTAFVEPEKGRNGLAPAAVNGTELV